MYGNMPMNSPQVQGGMGNPMDMSQMAQGGANPSQPMQNPMAQYQEQMKRQQMMKMMGQGLMGAGKGMQMPMPSGNTSQIIRDQGGPRMQPNQQQQMAQALRNR